MKIEIEHNGVAVKEDEDLKYKINILRERLWETIVEADYNLLDEKVQQTSRELDLLILEAMKLSN